MPTLISSNPFRLPPAPLLQWFRSDPLEELVGLDTSYHGGLPLSRTEEINPEYISAYKKNKESGTRPQRKSCMFETQSDVCPLEEREERNELHDHDFNADLGNINLDRQTSLTDSDGKPPATSEEPPQYGLKQSRSNSSVEI